MLKKRCFVINVYSKCNLMAKRRLCENLVLIRNTLGMGAWCFFGDFNSVCTREERRGVNVEPSSDQVIEMNYFNNLFHDL